MSSFESKMSQRNSSIIRRKSEDSDSEPFSEDDDGRKIAEDRSVDYWQQLYLKYRNYDLKKILRGILDKDINLYRRILINYSYQNKAVYSVKAYLVEENQHVIGYEGDNMVNVTDQDNAKNILPHWIEFDHLPRFLPRTQGIYIKHYPIETFDQLASLMTQFNPYWLLEVCAYSLAGGDFSNSHPNGRYNYEVQSEEIEWKYRQLQLVYSSINERGIISRNRIKEKLSSKKYSSISVSDDDD
jgi:hypothetical protein